MQNTTKTGTATFTRKGKTKTMAVTVDAAFDSLHYIRKADGKPFFGSTGYLNPTTGVVKTYRGADVAVDFTFTPDAA